MNLTKVLWMHRIFENWKIAVRLVNVVTPTNKVKNTNISTNYNNSAKVTSAMHSLYYVTLTLCAAMLFIKFKLFRLENHFLFDNCGLWVCEIEHSLENLAKYF